jgi:hypothetical protein
MLLMVDGTQTTSLQLTYYRCIGGYVNADAHAAKGARRAAARLLYCRRSWMLNARAAAPGGQRNKGRMDPPPWTRVLPHRPSASS